MTLGMQSFASPKRLSQTSTAKQDPAENSNRSSAALPKMTANLELWKPQPVVTFIVGKEEVKMAFVVHKNLATSNSPFFQAAFEGKFMEGATQTMRLEDVDSNIFGLLVHWLYTHRVIHSADSPSLILASGGHLLAYAKLWTLASRCLMPALQNHLILKLTTCLRFENHKEFIRFASRTDAEAPMKLLAIQAVAFFVELKDLRCYAKDLPGDFVIEVMMVLKEELPKVKDKARFSLRDLALRDRSIYFVKEN